MKILFSLKVHGFCILNMMYIQVCLCYRECLRIFIYIFGDFLKLQIRELLPLHKKFLDLKAQLELKLYDLKLFQGRAEQNEHHKVLLHSFLSLRYSKHRTMLSISFSGSYLDYS